MKKCILAGSLILMSMSSSGWAAITSCDQVKTKIEAKLAGKGVKDYSLQVVAKDAETKNRVVASCDGGKNKIIYQKTSAKKAGE